MRYVVSVVSRYLQMSLRLVFPGGIRRLLRLAIVDRMQTWVLSVIYSLQ